MDIVDHPGRNRHTILPVTGIDRPDAVGPDRHGIIAATSRDPFGDPRRNGDGVAVSGAVIIGAMFVRVKLIRRDAHHHIGGDRHGIRPAPGGKAQHDIGLDRHRVRPPAGDQRHDPGARRHSAARDQPFQPG